jgi:hypothetical protein
LDPGVQGQSGKETEKLGGFQMRRVVVLALLALALPIAASAGTIDITNDFGSITISDMLGTLGMGTIGSTTIASHESQLRSFDGITAVSPHALGYVNFVTGVLLSGSVSGGGTFSAAGSEFDVLGIGAWAHTFTGCGSCKNPIALFTGTFVGPIDWTFAGKGPLPGELDFVLSGEIAGTLFGGRYVTGTTTQNFDSYHDQLFQGIGHINVGTSQLTVPEPGTLGLLGTGLVGIAGLFRRKLIRS